MKNDLIEGHVGKSILYFTIPLLIGNFFQLLYNTVDSYVVGNYVSPDALAAVGQSTPIINVIVGAFLGLSTGAGVVISQYYGAKDDKRMSLAVHSAAALTLVLCMIFTIIGILVARPILELIRSPQSIMPLATLYLKIYFYGVSFVLIYNMGSGILRAIGDSKRPLYYLAISSLANVIFDFVFVLYLHLGVTGVAYGTLISQGLSALLVVIRLLSVQANYRLSVSRIHFDRRMTKKIIQIGVPTAIQNCIVSFSNVWSTSYINRFGANAVAGYAAYTKIDQFVILPVQSFSLAITTFVGQNVGAKKYERVKKGISQTLIMNEIIAFFFMVGLFFFGHRIIGLFTKKPDVIESGFLMAKVMCAGYIFIPITNILAGALRGVGISKIPMYTMVGCYVVIRQIYLAIAYHFDHSIVVVYLGWPLTWVICAILLVVYFKKANWLAHHQ